MLVLKCPKCGNTQRYAPQTSGVRGKSKACVYCGKNFKVADHVVKVEKFQK